MPTIEGTDWLLKLNNADLTTDPASNAQAITGTATDVAVTPAALMAALAALTFPINTSGLVSLAKTITSATPATTRLVQSELTVTPSTTVAVGSNGSLAAVRGAVTLTTAKSLTDGFMYGVQGKVVGDGSTIAVGSDHIAGLLGQLSMTGTTVTSAHMAGVISSIQGTPTNSNIDLFYGESATGNVINAMFKAFAKSDYVFDLASNVHTQMSLTGTAGASTAKGWLKVLVDGEVRYIALTDSVS